MLRAPASSAAAFHELLGLLLQRPGTAEADLRINDSAVAIDPEDGRNGGSSVLAPEDVFALEQNAMLELVFSDEPLDVVRRLVPCVDAENDELIAVLLRQLTQVRSLLTTGPSLIRPKGEQNRFPAQGRELDRTAAQLG